MNHAALLPPAAWPAPAPHRRALRWAGVLLAHALLVLLWRTATGPVQVSVAQGSSERVLQLLALRPVPVPVPAPAPPPPPRAATVAAAARPAAVAAQPPSPSPAYPSPPAQPTEPALSLLPEPAASAPRQEHLLDSLTTRQAIRDAARGPLLSERAATATGITPVTSAERLSNGAAAAGKGDCGKGEFAGGGMGLLSLPFLAVAAATGNCAR